MPLLCNFEHTNLVSWVTIPQSRNAIAPDILWPSRVRNTNLQKGRQALFSANVRKIPVYLLLLLVPGLSAQDMSLIPARLTVPDGTPVQMRLAQNISSSHAHVGDRLDFVVVRDVNVDGFTVIPAGNIAQGTVTGVKGKRFLGIGGKVSLKLDSVNLVNGEQVDLRGSKEVKGESRTKLMAAAMIATGIVFLPAAPIFLLTRGHESTVVKSTEITARIDRSTTILSAGLGHSRRDVSELDEMMDYLPPRVFNAEGREGDMLNLIFVAQPEDLQKAFARAGWVETDKWKPIFVWHLLRHGINDARVPMARFYLFGRVQDYSYALPDPDAIVSRRHHLRIWKTDYAIDGKPIWAAAATHDVAIEIAKGGHLINHRIDPAVDEERDFIGADLTKTFAVSRQEYLKCVDPVFNAETASGENYHSDSRVLLLDLYPITTGKTKVPGSPSAEVRATSLPNPSAGDFFSSNLLLPR
jgi:hypothetical protein